MKWLIRAQNPDGAWDAEVWGGQKQYTVGLTGLALSSLMAAESAPFNGPAARTVERAAAFLANSQVPEGHIGPLDREGEVITERDYITRRELELKNMLTVAGIIVHAALARKGSVGAHYRSDFRERGEHWQNHLVWDRKSLGNPDSGNDALPEGGCEL